jgi:hypothetical protein
MMTSNRPKALVAEKVSMSRSVRALLVFCAIIWPIAATAAPTEHFVWKGEKPVGRTWAKLGPGGSFEVKADSGIARGTRGLVLRMTGEDWRGCGLNWKGWYPPEACDDVSGYNALVLSIRQVSKERDADLTVHLVDNVKRASGSPASNGVSIVGDGGLERIDGEWRRVVLPLHRFTNGKPLDLKRIWGIDFSNQGDKALTFHIDRIGFAVEKIALPRFAAGKLYKASAKLLLGKGHAISPRIFGVAGWPREKLIAYGIPITRWGGNSSTRYNWMLNVDNGASDWFFKNRGRLITRLEESGYLTHIRGNQAFGATTYQTVPMIGWVAKDAHSYGFSVKKYGRQKASEPGHLDVGNGVKPDGTFIKGNDPRDTSVPAPPEFIAKAVRFVVKHAGQAGDRKPGVQYWVLDNEPMLWHATHRDVHPTPLSYEKLWERTVAYAEAIKKADPTAKVAGFCSWGWTDLFYSAADAGSDNYRTRPDFHKHGKMPLCEWFIKKCGEYRRANKGRTLVDVLDVHWYPQAQVAGQGPYLGKGMGPALNALRLRTTRDLWDPRYVQESWIRFDQNSPVALLPRVKKWIAKHNPGMELCLGEYDFGGSDNITGGLAQAEVLGVLAREGVDLAFFWHTPAGTQELAWKLFRNYDGKGGRFGEVFLPASSDEPQLSVFAARRKDGALTVAVVNKDLNRPCAVTLDVGEWKGTLRVWRFDQDSATEVREVRNQGGKVEGSARLTAPAASANLLVLTPSAGIR